MLCRFYARFQSRWEAEKIELVGTEPIPGKTVKREVNRSTHATKEVPVSGLTFNFRLFIFLVQDALNNEVLDGGRAGMSACISLGSIFRLALTVMPPLKLPILHFERARTAQHACIGLVVA